MRTQHMVITPWEASDAVPKTEKVVADDQEFDVSLKKTIRESYERQLIPLKEDVCLWLGDLLSIHIDPELFMTHLSNGVIICRLAELVSSAAYEAIQLNLTDKAVPRLAHSTWSHAHKGTFFARENITNFLDFCSRLGIHENLLFETEDLVKEMNARPIVLCLLEIGRIASKKWKLRPSNLVRMEEELEQNTTTTSDTCHRLEEDSGFSGGSSCASFISTWAQDRLVSLTPVSTPSHNLIKSRIPVRIPPSTPKTPKATIVQGSPLRTPGRSMIPVRSPKLEAFKLSHHANSNRCSTPIRNDTKLNRAATAVAQKSLNMCHCSDPKCSKPHMKKVSEGRYEIFGRIFTTRLLNNNHVMVRVGGGWNTLEHYLLTHVAVQVTPMTSTRRGCVSIKGRYVSPSVSKMVPKKLNLHENKVNDMLNF